jgi:acetoin utilization deacetylase AcuC-like enzyme
MIGKDQRPKTKDQVQSQKSKDQDQMTTAIIHHPVFQEHDTGPGHPETPSRYSVVMNALRNDPDLWSALREVKARESHAEIFKQRILRNSTNKSNESSRKALVTLTLIRQFRCVR